MTLKIPRAVLYVLAAGVVLGISIAAYFILREPAKDCLTASGSAVSCNTADSMTQAEYDQAQADKAAAEKAAAALAQCRSQTDGLQKALQELDSRLSVGLVYTDYSKQVGNARVAYDRVPTGHLSPDCLADVALHLENAMNDYAKAGTTSGTTVLTDFNCNTDSIQPDLQAQWSKASSEISKAKSGLTSIGSSAGGSLAASDSATNSETTSTTDSSSDCVNASSGEPMDCGDPGAERWSVAFTRSRPLATAKPPPQSQARRRTDCEVCLRSSPEPLDPSGCSLREPLIAPSVRLPTPRGKPFSLRKASLEEEERQRQAGRDNSVAGVGSA